MTSRRLLYFGLAAIVVVAAVWAVAAIVLAPLPGPYDDVAIVNAVIYDGTGAPPFKGGLTIRGARITAVWRGWRFPLCP